ncbi:ABC transporter substrate-binding protein [Thioclava dalianensis]|uniref:ABC transporter substrate-binding protein n=1 Tax=Thioclava dalianensis TaxID=1185766 RepID=A0A074TH62_9RHOB|nr:ABC transporter substrate-binding protein [Thioclava dalianensis]SFN68131.1 peptide/nickel transport system substrate-binding protein [Thioclava dalianensis]
MMPRLLTAVAALLLSTASAWAARDTITIGMVLEPPNLDPTAGAAAAIDEVVYANVFQGLTRFGPDGSIRPDLAKSWDVSEDGTRYTFHLQEGVTFQDGSRFDAKDVKFSLDRARADDSVNAQKQLFAGIEQVTVIDPLTVEVTLKAPDGALPFKLAWGDAVMVAPESAADNATHPIGTGPFMFKDWAKGDHVTLSAYEGYWGQPPKLREATFRFISDPTAAFSALMAGDVDAFPNYPAPETAAQFKADPRFKLIIGSTEGETILAMNERNPPLNDTRVRAAIAHALNRADIINGAMFGYGTPIGTHFAPHNPAYVDLTALSNYDPAESKALLKEAGVSDLTLRMALPPPSYARRSGEIIQAELAAVGIQTKITNMEWADWLERVFKGHDFDLTVVSHTEPMDIGIYARPDYYFGYNSPKFDAVMQELEGTSDPDKRTELLQQAQRILAEDYANAFLFQLPKIGVANAKIEGLWKNAPTQANDLTQVYWDE